jgi:hypothetical protein
MKTYLVLRPIAAACPALALCAVLLCSCATSPRADVQPWLKDSRKVGTLTRAKRSWGYDYEYRDLSGRLVRVERRSNDLQLCAGACIVRFEYDEARNLQAEQHLDAAERPCLAAAGYARCRWARWQAPDGCRVVEESFFDCEQMPVCRQEGFAVARSTCGPDGRLKELRFLNASRSPAAATWLGVQNVADVQYSYLQGVGEVTCAAFLDAAGSVIARRELAGQTSGSWSTSVTTYNSYNYRNYGATGGARNPSARASSFETRKPNP